MGPRHHAEGLYDAATSTYQVVAGDDLFEIAKRFATTVAELKALNKLDSDLIDVDQTLVVSTGAAGVAVGSLEPFRKEIEGMQQSDRGMGVRVDREITGKPGSPSATTTIEGNQLPPMPDEVFGGKIERNVLQSKPYWPPRVAPAKGSPNVLLIMTDDSGYAVPSTFGGVIPTPALDRIANNGLRYTNFHSTAVCSATRAAIITGRNHHQMGYGTVAETSTGFPGYNSIMTRDKATVGAYAQFSPTTALHFVVGYQFPNDASAESLSSSEFGFSNRAWLAHALWTSDIAGLGPARYALTYYESPATGHQPASQGWSLNAEQDLGETWALFGRANAASGLTASIGASYALELAVKDPLHRSPTDRIGLAVGYSEPGDPPAVPTGARSEKIVELYWNWTLC